MLNPALDERKSSTKSRSVKPLRTSASDANATNAMRMDSGVTFVKASTERKETNIYKRTFESIDAQERDHVPLAKVVLCGPVEVEYDDHVKREAVVRQTRRNQACATARRYRSWSKQTRPKRRPLVG